MAAPAPSRPARHRAWVDLRLVLGVLLILVSVGGVWLVVTAARQTVPVYAATRTLVPGEAITAADMRLVEVGLGPVAGSYLGEADPLPQLVATRTIEAGELVARTAVGEAATLRTTSIVVRSAADVPASVSAGSVVDVWSAPPLDQGRYDVPRILVPDAVVIAVDATDGAFSGAAAVVELVVARADVAAVLAAMTSGAAISIVPAAGATR